WSRTTRVSRTAPTVASPCSTARWWTRKHSKSCARNPRRERTSRKAKESGMHAILDDTRFALRALKARPGFVLAAVLTLALGLGANTAIFSVINAFLLKPLPYPDGERLVEVHNSYPGNGLPNAGVSVPDYLDRRAHADAL